jgi:hypothetical protein
METRSWRTSYRGPVAIHVAQHLGAEERMLCGQPPFKECLDACGYGRLEDLPRGMFVAIAELGEILPTEKVITELSERERAFGNYAPGRYAWRLDQMRPIHPWPARGQQGLWELNQAMALFLRARVKDLC